MAISLLTVIVLWVWIGHIGPTYSSDTLTLQQKTLRQHFGLRPQPVITDPKLLLTPPSLRDVKISIVNMTKSSAGTNSTANNATIVPGASTLADKAFSPNPINVKVGSSVIWTNKDNVAHTVTSGTGSSDPNKGKEFDSGLSTLLTPGKTFSHTFKTAGEIPYFCQIHPTMVGKVTVS
ncbi:MAG TPA: plastocyanin/azurin family copper-binding protein [Candidatus Nitrosopolaris sp.]|nr:plastocyanin/azurin family copper-binding protein [Candidatus Nitrosopolaris sp.]